MDKQLYDGLLCGLPTEIAVDLMCGMVEGRNTPSSFRKSYWSGVPWV